MNDENAKLIENAAAACLERAEGDHAKAKAMLIELAENDPALRRAMIEREVGRELPSNDVVFHAHTGVWPTPEMHDKFLRNIARLMQERGSTGKTVGEVLTEGDIQLCMRKAAGLDTVS